MSELEKLTNEIEQLEHASTEHLREIALWLGNELKEAMHLREIAQNLYQIGRNADEEIKQLKELLQRLHDWDMMDATADGNYWRKEIQKVLEGE